MEVPLSVDEFGLLVGAALESQQTVRQSGTVRKRSPSLIRKLLRSASSLAVSFSPATKKGEHDIASSTDNTTRRSRIRLASLNFPGPISLNFDLSSESSQCSGSSSSSDTSHQRQPSPYFLQRIPTHSVYPDTHPYGPHAFSGLMTLHTSTSSIASNCTLESLTTASSRSSGEASLSTPVSGRFPPVSEPEQSLCLVGSKRPRHAKLRKGSCPSSFKGAPMSSTTGLRQHQYHYRSTSSPSLRAQAQVHTPFPAISPPLNPSFVISDGTVFWTAPITPSASSSDLHDPPPVPSKPVSAPKKSLRKIVTRIDGSRRDALHSQAASPPPACPLPLVPVY